MSQELYKIEAGIPVPMQKRGRPPKMPINLMQPGDSMLVPQRINASVYCKNGKHFVIRKVLENGVEAFRLWRVV